MSSKIEPCVPEFIDGSYEGCGICPDCLEDEDQEIEQQVEMGLLTDDQARELHHDNEMRRAMGGLLDDDDAPEPDLSGAASDCCGHVTCKGGEPCGYVIMGLPTDSVRCQCTGLPPQGPQTVRGVDGSKDGA